MVCYSKGTDNQSKCDKVQPVTHMLLVTGHLKSNTTDQITFSKRIPTKQN